MNTRNLLLLVAALAAGSAIADNFTRENNQQVAKIIEAAVEAHGGSAGLDALDTLMVTYEDVNHAVGQSRGAEAPWDTSPGSGFNAIDLNDGVFVTHAETSGGGFEGNNKTIINGEESYQLDLRAGTAAPIAEPDFPTTSGPFVRVTPALLVRTLRDRESNAFYLGESRSDGKTYDLVGFSMEVGPAITLYFDSKTGLLGRSERLLPGIGLVEYEFRNYETKAGMPFNRDFRLYLNGELNIDRRNRSVALNEPLDELLVVDAGLQSIPQVTPDPLTRQELADGVWLIGGSGTYAMFVDMGDYIFAAGGAAGIPERIASLREVAGDKPLRYGMLTHHHFDHVLGVAAYEAEGATVIAAEAHEKVAREAAEKGEELDMLTVSGRYRLEANDRVIEIRDIGPTAHTEHLLVAWLPEEGILFEADHFTMPRSGPIPPAVSSTKSFAEALRREDLVPAKLVSAHSPQVATMEDLAAALSAEPARQQAARSQ